MKAKNQHAQKDRPSRHARANVRKCAIIGCPIFDSSVFNQLCCPPAPKAQREEYLPEAVDRNEMWCGIIQHNVEPLKQQDSARICKGHLLGGVPTKGKGSPRYLPLLYLPPANQEILDSYISSGRYNIPPKCIQQLLGGESSEQLAFPDLITVKSNGSCTYEINNNPNDSVIIDFMNPVNKVSMNFNNETVVGHATTIFNIRPETIDAYIMSKEKLTSALKADRHGAKCHSVYLVLR